MSKTSIRGSEAQGATFVELFFDLVFVFAVTQVTGVLGHDLTGGGVVRALVVFWLVWWAWTQYTWSLNAVDTELDGVRLYTLAATGIAFIMALTVPELTSDIGWLFCVAYVALRIVGIGMQWRLTEGEADRKATVRKWTVMSSLGLVAVAVGAVLEPEPRMVALAIAALLDVIAATRAGSGTWELYTSHFTERHGLIVIIALGESLIAAGVAASGVGIDARITAVALLAVITACALWWTYFGWVKDTMEEAFAAQPLSNRGSFARNVYSFGHFPIIAGVIGFAVAIEESVAHPTERLLGPGVIALVAGVTLFVGGTALALRLSGHRPSALRVIAVVLFATIGASAFMFVPAWIAMGFAAVMASSVAMLERRPDLES